MKILAVLIAVVALLAGCASSGGRSEPRSRPTFVDPETPVRTTAPVKVASRKYDDCDDAVKAAQGHLARAIDYGSEGDVAELRLAVRRAAKTIIVNEDCFPAGMVAETPDPDVVEVERLPQWLEKKAPEHCKPVLRDAQTLLNFTGGLYSKGERTNTARLRKGLTEISQKHPKCFPPALAASFDSSLERDYPDE